MKWMLHDRKKKELIFKLEEHEITDEMQHNLYLDSPEKKQIFCGPSTINSRWELRFKLPDELVLPLGRWEFFVNGTHIKGDMIVASGFSIGSNLICHQAVSKRI